MYSLLAEFGGELKRDTPAYQDLADKDLAPCPGNSDPSDTGQSRPDQDIGWPEDTSKRCQAQTLAKTSCGQ